MEDIREQSRKEGLAEGIKTTTQRMLKSGKYALDEITAISGLAVDEVKRLQSGKTQGGEYLSIRHIAQKHVLNSADSHILHRNVVPNLTHTCCRVQFCSQMEK